MSELKIGDIARFFHPEAFGAMYRGKITKIHDNGLLTVKFDVPTVKGERVFQTTPEFIKKET